MGPFLPRITGSLAACVIVHASANLLTILTNVIPELNTLLDTHRVLFCLLGFVLFAGSFGLFLMRAKKHPSGAGERYTL